MKNEQIKEYLKKNYDENDDIIVPNSIFGELLYIFYILSDICKNKTNRNEELKKLKRQILFFTKWMKNK